MSEPKSSRSRYKTWWAWLAILLLPAALALPVWGERLQVELIGYEGFCCAPENFQELREEAAHAKSLRPVSNFIIGASLVLAIMLVVLAAVVLYRYALPHISRKPLRYVGRVVVGLVIAPLGILLLVTVAYFIVHNDEYFSTRYHPPREVLYAYALRELTSD